MSKTFIYIHWPFCKSKCPYCDFNSHVRENERANWQYEWFGAYKKEIDFYSENLQDKIIDTIFFGGGTPSLMQPEVAAGILQHLKSKAELSDNVEITLEANPTSSEAEKFQSFADAGINRVSIGVQSLQQDALKFLGREHNADEALKTVQMAADIFDRYSFDLIYARPQQSIENWQNELQEALKYAGGHLSLYQLTIEKGTEFYSAHRDGEFKIPDDVKSAELYELTEKIMTNAGYATYEVSNYAKPGDESRHNMNYWKYGEYIGIGAGAHGRLIADGGRVATMNIHNPEQWLAQVKEKGNGLQKKHQLSEDDMLAEYIMMGLRLKEGIKFADFKLIFAADIYEKLNAEKLKKCQEHGYIEIADGYMRATNAGRMLLGSVVEVILP